MFFEEPDQNPEKVDKITTQEEKPKTVTNTVENNNIMDKTEASAVKQIQGDEQKEIVNLLHGATPEKTEPAVSEPKEPVKQIDEKEAVVVADLLKDRETESQVAVSVEKSEKGDETLEIPAENAAPQMPAKQIGNKERKLIIRLLKDGSFKKSEAEEDHEVIDYDQLNKQELVELFEELVQDRDIAKIKAKVGKINKAFHRQSKEKKDHDLAEFIAAGGVREEYVHIDDPLEQRFKVAFNHYKHNKSKYAEEVEKEKLENLQAKLNILEELKELISSEETLKKTYDEFKRLQESWKEIGLVPAGELNNLWQNYHFLVEKFFDKVRINKELRDLDLKKNMEIKIELCEKAEELILEKSIIKSFKLLQKYHDEWREVGPVPLDKKEELWERFKAATEKINFRRKEHYKELQEEQLKNLEAKTALCEKAEEIVSLQDGTLKEWNKRTEDMDELFKMWKSIGRATNDMNDVIWVRFKSSLDNFFAQKREFLGKLKDVQMNNLNMKIDLCVQAEAIKDSEDWRNATNDLIRMQKEWKEIGPVPRRHSDKVWKRFRSACDTFFKRKSDFFKNIHGVEAENLKKKKDIIKEIAAFKVTSKKEKDMAAVQDFQRRWIEIGHVPFKEKDKIQQQYREAIDKLIDTMDINKMDLTQAGYESKIELLKNDPDSDWRLSKERGSLQIKIKKIKEDVALWENNIGFFSGSKNSEIFRKEFELKIEKAKQEIESLEAKMKVLG